MPCSKNIEASPALEETLVALEEHRDEVILDELWAFVHDEANDVWTWIALSRHNLQVLALEDGQKLWQHVPQQWKEFLVFTDDYSVYRALLQDRPHKHCVTFKGERQTSKVEGTNNALRQRVSYLVRRTSAFGRSHHWNLRQAKEQADTRLEKTPLCTHSSKCSEPSTGVACF